jgi:hypothetical protein
MAQVLSFTQPVTEVTEDRFTLVLREGPGPAGGVRREIEVLDYGAPLWRMPPDDLGQLATLTRGMDEGLRVVVLRREAFPLEGKVGDFTASVKGVTLKETSGEVTYSGRLSYGEKSAEFNATDIRVLRELSQDMQGIVRQREQGMSIEAIAQERSQVPQPEPEESLEPEF